MFRNFLTVSGWTVISRILGLVRDQCLAFFIGAGMMQDAYQVAARLPNMFRRLFGEGAFNAAFVPIFSSLLAKNDRKQACYFVRTVLGLMLIGLTLICCVGEIFMPQLLHIFAPGFVRIPEEYHLAVTLCRITFPYLIFICGVALLSGVLNGLHDFGIAAASYLIFNIVGIACIVGAYCWGKNIVIVAAWGMCIAGIIQFFLLCGACYKHHFLILPIRKMRITKYVKQLGKRMVPGLIGSGAGQINLVIDTIIGTFLPAGSISVMYFADRVNQLPLGVIGAACGTTLLPVLSHHLIRGQYFQATQAQNKTLILGMMFSLPATAGLFVLAQPILLSLFGHGAFNYQDALNSAQCLCVYAIGLPAFVLIKIITPSFFARGDTRTPVQIGLITIILNVILNVVFMKPLSFMGPPLASSICAIINVLFLGYLLKTRKMFYILPATYFALLKIFFASLLMSLLLVIVRNHLHSSLQFMVQFLSLIGAVMIGAASYFFTLYLLRFKALGTVKDFFTKT